MSKNENRVELKIAGEKTCGGCCNSTHPVAGGGLSRRNFLQGMAAAGVAALGGMAGMAHAAEVRAESSEPTPGTPFVRHGDGTNVSFADGHSNYWKYRGAETIKGGKLRDRTHPSQHVRPKQEAGHQDLYRVRKSCWWEIEG